MKSILFTLLFTIKLSFCFSQIDKTYYNESLEKCDKEKSTYFRTVTKLEDKFLVIYSFTNTNSYKSTEICTSVDPIIKNGICTYYDHAGFKTCEGTFTDNKKSGRWVTRVENGKDSTVEDFLSDGNVKATQTANTSRISSSSRVYSFVEKMPKFTGGDDVMNKYFSSQFVMSNIDLKKNIHGKVFIEFVVDDHGSISNPKVLRSLSPDADAEAIRLVTQMPKWIPGQQNGNNVSVRYSMPIVVVNSHY